MNRLHRLGAMILAFWLLANAVGASVPPGTRGETSRVAVLASLHEPHGSSTPLTGRIPPRRADVGGGPTLDRDGQSPIEPELRRMLEGTGTDEMIRVLVHMRARADAPAISLGTMTEAEGRARLVSSLRTAADRSQAPVRAYLDAQRVAGRVASYEPLWVTNAIAVRATPSVVRFLAAQPSVATVRLDQWRQWVAGEKPEYVVGPAVRFRSQMPEMSIRAPVIHHAAPSSEEGARRAQSIEWNVSRVRADEVWHALQISGTGALVAGMDTGVDWLHPALQSSYRGYNPHGPSNHTHSWYDATEQGALYPVDGHGHGSHTLGTIVGQGGIGIAPGARWIGVRVLSNQGYGYDSWIHAGFQWLLAPGGDPARAPDVVNCSWASANAYLTTFQDDLRALRAAGILAVFANGNYGLGEGSVGSPASLPEAFAVGAVDEYDEVADFSARGPSPWGEIRPHVAAPGVQVRSSMPGGAYASMQGTSMAAPHVTGVAAMLRSVSPTLSITRTIYAITSTAVPLGGQVPNNDSGWGRIDAFAAVAALAQPGFITGTVQQALSPETAVPRPIVGAMVTATPHGAGGEGMDNTATDGSYRLALAPGTYDLVASAFGHQPATLWGVPVAANVTTVRDFVLTSKPTGSLRVRVSDASTDQPITATVTVLDTPYEVITHTDTLHLPADTYTVRARRLSYRVVTATVAITVGEITSVDLALPYAPSILLVDSGRWYYESQASYFRQALEDLSYAYHELPIRHLPGDIPSAADLTPYDIVIWSAPRDAPGYIGAEDAVAGYLEAGGRLLLTGQDVGFWDGGGTLTYLSPYYRQYLKAGFVDDNAPTRSLWGLAGDIFAGTVITITGLGGADNQDYPDVISIADPDAAAPVLAYYGGGCGGIRVGTCLDYRAAYLPFGFEAINDRASRGHVMEEALAWLVAAPPNSGLEIQPKSQLRIGAPGSMVTHTLRVRHLGQGGSPDEINLTLRGASWPTEVGISTLTLSPCTSATVAISVTIPVTADWHLRDVVTVTARSSLSPTLVVSAALTTKAPAPILLVDDDRWYDQGLTYEETMEKAHLPYDLWQGSPEPSAGHAAGPPLEILELYPIVVWWTGYDWYAPITDDEEASLKAYLDRGGRVFLSSQDFLYYHHDDPFSLRYLGVLTHTEDVTPTVVSGVSEDLVGDGLGPWILSYPDGYQNWSDGLMPAPETGVAFRDQGRQATALTRRERGHGTLFLAFPFEALPGDVRPTLMEQAVGWLSWLGESTFEADPRSVAPGDEVTYTITLRSDGLQAVTASVSNTLPPDLAIRIDSVRGPGQYSAKDRQLSWLGSLEPSEVVTLSYRAAVLTGTESAEAVINEATVALQDHLIGFSRNARVRIDAPDLSSSTFRCEPPSVRPGDRVSCTLRVANTGAGDADPATARIHAPGNQAVIANSVWTGTGMAQRQSNTIHWSGLLVRGGTATLRFELDLPLDPIRRTLYGVTFLDDGAGGTWERPAWVDIHPWQAYLPVVMKEAR